MTRSRLFKNIKKLTSKNLGRKPKHKKRVSRKKCSKRNKNGKCTKRRKSRKHRKSRNVGGLNSPIRGMNLRNALMLDSHPVHSDMPSIKQLSKLILTTNKNRSNMRTKVRKEIDGYTSVSRVLGNADNLDHQKKLIHDISSELSQILHANGLSLPPRTPSPPPPLPSHTNLPERAHSHSPKEYTTEDDGGPDNHRHEDELDLWKAMQNEQ